MTSTPRTRRRPALERVLKTADLLFYRDGIQATGVDLVVREADVSKATLYAHFRTKDDLVVDYLRRRSHDWRSTLTSELERRGGTPRDQIGDIFDILGDWFSTDGYRGCPFINAEAEYGTDAATHVVTKDHRAWVYQLFLDLAKQAGAGEPMRIARRLSIVYDGAMSSAQSEPEIGWAAEAKEAAFAIVDSGLAVPLPTAH